MADPRVSLGQPLSLMATRMATVTAVLGIKVAGIAIDGSYRCQNARCIGRCVATYFEKGHWQVFTTIHLVCTKVSHGCGQDGYTFLLSCLCNHGLVAINSISKLPKAVGQKSGIDQCITLVCKLPYIAYGSRGGVLYTDGIVAKTIFLVAVCKISHWLGVDDDVDHGGISQNSCFHRRPCKAYGKGAAFMIGVFRSHLCTVARCHRQSSSRTTGR